MGDGLEKGVITCIHVENFVTYDKVTLKPLRYLNVSVGSNGSGKPTIVDAIVLGLGGKPNIIGHVGEYVKFGRDSARIEIHLKNGTKQDSVVTRTFTREGKSTWMINGNQANDKSVQEFTSKLNIQVDNLCQFLSQDKVQDFSKMDAQALLENTERSVGDPKLLEYHLKLKEQRTNFKALEVDVANTKRLLESKTQRRDELQQVVATIKEIKSIKKKIVTLKQKKAWTLYDQMRRKLVESNKNRDLAVKEMQAIEAELKPIKKQIEQMKSDMTTLKNLFDDHNKIINAKITKLRNIVDDILSCENKIQNAIDTRSRRIQTEQAREQDIKLAQNQKSKLENDFAKEVEAKIRKKTKVLYEYRANRNKYQQNIQHIQALKCRIHIAVDKIKLLEMGRMSIDDIKADFTKEIKSIIRKQGKMYTEYNAIQLECYNYNTSNTKIVSEIFVLQLTLLNETNNVNILKDKFTTAERTFKKHVEEFQSLKREAERLYNEALTSINNISSQDDAFKALNKAFKKLPATVAEINNELNIAQAKVFCISTNMDAETILQEYEEIQNDIQKLTELVKKQTGELEEMTRKIEKLKQKWLKPLGQLVEKINANFSSYFFTMDCAGEVTLSHGENVLDFHQYGLKIKVKFRDADELQELTGHFQSGGERMAATAIYMIALQELSRVPFRCVDEINQGMDAVNERRVFDLLVKMAVRPGSSQYFLLTPKGSLLPNLTYTETVTVHSVFNRSVKDEEFEFDLEDYCNYLALSTDK